MNPIPSNLSKNCRDFIQKVLTPNPDKRPSVNEILQHKWLKESIDYRYVEIDFRCTKITSFNADSHHSAGHNYTNFFPGVPRQ